MDVLTVCPRLIPVNITSTVYRGFIRVGAHDFQLELELEEPGQSRNAKIECEWKLKELLRGNEAIIQQRMQQCPSLAAFLTEFTRIVECKLGSRRHTDVLVPLPSFYAQLIDDISTLGWNRLSYIDPSFKELHLVTTDGRGRKHTLKVRLHPQHPQKAPNYSSQLPISFDCAWSKQSKLTDIFVGFNECVGQFQDFWDVMDEIDTGTCVLEPEKPTRNALRRRIALGQSASLQIEVDPQHCRQIPYCRFLGAELVIGPLKDNFNRNISNWSTTDGLLTNLQTVLCVVFPSPKTSRKEDFIAECGICYTYRLIDELPDQSCENTHCAQTFHRSCLSEWLRSLATSRLSFNVLFGDCPYCKKPITVKVIPH